MLNYVQILGCSLSGIVESGGDAVDGGTQGAVQRFTLRTGAFALQEFHLNQAHRVHVRVPQPDGL